MNKYSKSFIEEIPKTDLHLHLDGSLRIPSLIDMAKKLKVDLPCYTEEGLREKVFKSHYNNLGEYLEGFQYTCAVMRDLENIEQISYELAWDNINEKNFPQNINNFSIFLNDLITVNFYLGQLLIFNGLLQVFKITLPFKLCFQSKSSHSF